MHPELGRDAGVAIILIAAIVALATGSPALGGAVLGAGVLLVGGAVLIRSRAGASRHARAADPHH